MTRVDPRSCTHALHSGDKLSNPDDALMSLWSMDEQLLAGCDVSCYEADSSPDDCQCLCGGHNHGAGLERALAQTRVHGNEWVRSFVRSHSITDFYAMTVVEPEEIERQSEQAEQSRGSLL